MAWMDALHKSDCVHNAHCVRMVRHMNNNRWKYDFRYHSNYIDCCCFTSSLPLSLSLPLIPLSNALLDGFYHYVNIVVVVVWCVCILHSGTHSCQLQFDVLGPIRRISEYQREHNEASRDIGKYISNPINAYLLTKRLTSDWKAVEQVMAHDVSSRK